MSRHREPGKHSILRFYLEMMALINKVENHHDVENDVQKVLGKSGKTVSLPISQEVGIGLSATL